jgi:hypothetical protein
MRVFTGLACLLFACAAAAEPAPIQVMVLGTYHMSNPGQDLHNVKAADVLTPERQRELAAVAEALASFKPTLVALEKVTAPPQYLDASYPKFDAGQLSRDRDERVQIGYRVAQLSGLEEVHGIDEQPAAGEPDYFPFERVQASAHAHGEDAALGALMQSAGAMVARFGEQQSQMTIAQLLLEANDSKSLADASAYYEFLKLDSGEDQPASELLGYWFMRNAKIFAKLRDIAQPGDRVLVLFGAGHKHWLEQLASNSPGFQLVDASDYLRKAK